MSYEAKMMKQFKMPNRSHVEREILMALFRHNGVLTDFSSHQEIVDEIAICFNLNLEQKKACLKTVYKKENRIKKVSLWHRLLFRAANKLAESKYITRPKETFLLTKKREWMLTEKGYDKVLYLLELPKSQKEKTYIKSFEVEMVSKELQKVKSPENYFPFELKKENKLNYIEKSIRKRGFRHAVLEAYDYKCAICGLKLPSPNMNIWEVEAAHIIPHSQRGKDDIWNGISLCHLHHWAFDIGWFTILDNYSIQLSPIIKKLDKNYGKMFNFEILKNLENKSLYLPENNYSYPHKSVMLWHIANKVNGL